MAGGQRRRGRLDDGGVAQQRIAVAGGERGGDQAAGPRAQQLGAVDRIVPVVLGRQLAGEIYLRSGDVGVDVDAAGHHDHPAGVDPAGVGADVGDHLAVLDTQVSDLSVDVVGGVVDRAAADPDRGHADLREQACQQRGRGRRLAGQRRLQRQRRPVEPVRGPPRRHTRGGGANRHLGARTGRCRTRSRWRRPVAGRGRPRRTARRRSLRSSASGRVEPTGSG